MVCFCLPFRKHRDIFDPAKYFIPELYDLSTAFFSGPAIDAISGDFRGFFESFRVIKLKTFVTRLIRYNKILKKYIHLNAAKYRNMDWLITYNP